MSRFRSGKVKRQRALAKKRREYRARKRARASDAGTVAAVTPALPKGGVT